MAYPISVESIVSKICFIRGERVLLDRDLATLYGVKTKALKQAVRRNIKRFPDDFMFQLTKEESLSLRSQNVTLKRGEHSKYLPYAFTEQGVAMLSSVLNSESAIEANIAIMRAFVHLRKLALSYEVIERKLREIEDRLEGHDVSIEAIFEAIRQLMAPPEKDKEENRIRSQGGPCPLPQGYKFDITSLSGCSLNARPKSSIVMPDMISLSPTSTL